ncbi:MAG: hypothetical protein KGL68_03075 [Burkholderiales bacterium]|nr:hypothetical protein [Burkholderiales bacterium]
MRKVLQLVFGEPANIAAVALALAVSAAAHQVWPAASGWILVLALLAGAGWMASR